MVVYGCMLSLPAYIYCDEYVLLCIAGTGLWSFWSRLDNMQEVYGRFVLVSNSHGCHVMAYAQAAGLPGRCC